MNSIVKILVSATARAGHVLQKNASSILLTSGIGATIGGTIWACHSSTKIGEHCDQLTEDIDIIESTVEKGSQEYYTQRGRALGTFTGNALKLYAGPVALVATGITAILVSHKILRSEHLKAVAAYSGLLETLNGYRNRVRDKVGENEEFNLFYDVHDEEVVVDKYIDNNGKEVIVTKDVKVPNNKKSLKNLSEGAMIFDETNPNWADRYEYNITFLKEVEDCANRMLIYKGYLFENDLRKLLGFNPTYQGSLRGWIKYDNETEVDLGIWNICKQENVDFLNGSEPAVIIEPNVQGVIWDKIYLLGCDYKGPTEQEILDGTAALDLVEDKSHE